MTSFSLPKDQMKIVPDTWLSPVTVQMHALI